MKLLYIFVLFISLNTIGCIHFSIGEPTPQKASNVIFNDPLFPFEIMKKSEADQSWQSTKTGNIISLFSDCSKTSDKSLSLAFNELLKSFDKIEHQKRETTFYNNRESLSVELVGFIDGIEVFMASTLFNKNQCFYQLSYSGLANEKQTEISFYETFLKDFKAP